MLYAAYGSNLNKDQMAWRCPGAKAAGVAYIEGYRLMFKGSKSGAYLTIEPKDGCRVPVGIWEVNENHVSSLDRYEGFPDFYYKKMFEVDMNGTKQEVMAYVMHEGRPIGIPSQHYIEVCTKGYKDFGFDLKTLLAAVRRVA